MTTELILSPDVIKSYENYLKSIKHYSKNTVLSYVKCANDLAKIMKREKFSNKNIHKFIQIQSSSLESSSLSQKISALKNFCNFLNKRYKPTNSIQLKISNPKVSKKFTEIIKEKDIKKIYNLISKRPIEEKILFHFLYGCGLRISEALCAEYKNFDWEKKQFLVLGKGNKQRKVNIYPTLYDLLQKHKSTNLKIFETAKTTRTLRRWVYNWQKLIPDSYANTSWNPHLFRHTIASTLLKNGMKIHHLKKFLGHSDIKSTQIYTHLDISDIQMEYDEIIK